jgi:hypothetical protein
MGGAGGPQGGAEVCQQQGKRRQEMRAKEKDKRQIKRALRARALRRFRRPLLRALLVASASASACASACASAGTSGFWLAGGRLCKGPFFPGLIYLRVVCRRAAVRCCYVDVDVCFCAAVCCVCGACLSMWYGVCPEGRGRGLSLSLQQGWVMGQELGAVGLAR